MRSETFSLRNDIIKKYDVVLETLHIFYCWVSFGKLLEPVPNCGRSNAFKQIGVNTDKKIQLAKDGWKIKALGAFWRLASMIFLVELLFTLHVVCQFITNVDTCLFRTFLPAMMTSYFFIYRQDHFLVESPRGVVLKQKVQITEMRSRTVIRKQPVIETIWFKFSSSASYFIVLSAQVSVPSEYSQKLWKCSFKEENWMYVKTKHEELPVRNVWLWWLLMSSTGILIPGTINTYRKINAEGDIPTTSGFNRRRRFGGRECTCSRDWDDSWSEVPCTKRNSFNVFPLIITR